MQRALVLGGETGLLGQALVAELKKRPDCTIATLGRNDGDVFAQSFLAAKIADFYPDIVFNTIAFTQVDDAEEHEAEAERVNVTFPLMLATLLLPTSAHLIHFSTDFVFGGSSDRPRSEEDIPEPESVYGKTKLAGEKAVLENLPERSAVVRTAWLFGPHRKNFVATILNAAKSRKNLTVVDDQTGSPTFTADLAQLSVLLAERGACGIWHAVNSGTATWFELACEAVQRAHLDCTVTPIPGSAWPQKAKRPAWSVLSNAKLSAFLSRPIRSWQEALADYVQNRA